MINTALFLVDPGASVVAFARELKQRRFQSFIAPAPTADLLSAALLPTFIYTGLMRQKNDRRDPAKLKSLAHVVWGIRSIHPRRKSQKRSCGSQNEITKETFTDIRGGTATNIQLVVLDLEEKQTPSEYLMLAYYALEYERWVVGRRKDWERLTGWLDKMEKGEQGISYESITAELMQPTSDFFRNHFHEMKRQADLIAHLKNSRK